MFRRYKHHRIDLEVLLGSVTRTVRDAAALMVTRTVREDRVNGNPNRQGGIGNTKCDRGAMVTRTVREVLQYTANHLHARSA